MDWDHLRYFLAVAHSGSLSGAAASLGVNHSTVFRRINALERQLGVRLFDRLREGYLLTAAGEAVCEEASRAADSIDALQRAVLGQDHALGGDVRITTAPNLATHFVAPALAELRISHPGIRVEVAVSDTDYDLARRQADLALRATPAPPEYLVGRHVLAVPWFVYGSPSYMKRCGTPRAMPELAGHDLVGADEALRRLPALEWLHSSYPNERFVATANQLNTVAALIAAGLGLGVLPADQHREGIVRLFAMEPALTSELWMLSHPDLRRVARIRAVSDHLLGALRADPRLREFG
ncbi:MAG: LysR family transcriptional regulator [Lysobacterales bacterium]|jgi:DNA-binding transcriptional LysR family regulator